MQSDLLDLYDRASAWTLDKVKHATPMLDQPSTCDEWDVRTLLNHMLETQRYFVGAARGKDVSPPSQSPPNLLSTDPVADFQQVRVETMATFAQPGVIERTGPSLGIAFSDQLVHGWDVAKATGQDQRMPTGLPEAAFDLIHGKFTDEQRKGVFKSEIDSNADASAQDRLLAYTGRDPAR